MKRYVFVTALFCCIINLSFASLGTGNIPIKEAKAAAVYDRLKEEFIFIHNGHEALPVASTTKIMTSLLALEEENLDEAFIISPKALNAEGSSMGLKKGDKVTLRTLSCGMMLSSGNDAANGAAIRLSGSIDAFPALMNERAKKIGMKDTKFSTPSGLDCGENLSSACDMALLANEALKNPDFAKLSSLKTARIDVGKRLLYLKNHNRLLWKNENVTGIKTGFTKKAGRCLVTSADIKGREFIIVTLNLYDDFNIHDRIYKEIERNLKETDLSCLFEGAKADVAGGISPSVRLCLKDKAVVPIFKDELGKLSKEVKIPPFLYAPLANGEKVGNFLIKIEEKEVKTLPLYTSFGVELKVRKNVLCKVRDFFGQHINF